MAKKWGKNSRQSGRGGALGDLGGDDPRTMFGAPSARRSAPPASSTPLADYLSQGWPGVDDGYVVLPRTLAESMPLPWQQQLTRLLTQFHGTHAELSWPTYRVVPSRRERLVDLDEEQLAEAGYLVEIDSDGEMVYRERSGRRVPDPENMTVLVSCLDPIVRQQPSGDDGSRRGEPAPMNIGPQPVWHTTDRRPAAPDAPPLPPPPTAPALTTPGGREAAAEPREPVEPPTWLGDATGAAEPGDGGGQPDEQREPDGEFGPTGDEPTEIPYRYRR